ncbi:MAG: TRAM domain-containing protein [Planctomycetia bacterium]|nr:TRAM domain-containing protein [Planctomycetia bacterium]
MVLIILRAVFILITSGLSITLINSKAFYGKSEYAPMITFACIMTLALLVILVDVLFPRKRLQTITSVYFGLIVGFFLSYMVNIGLTPLYSSLTADTARAARIQNASYLVLTVIMCYVSISLLYQTRNDFRFIIPYVELSKELKGLLPYVLDVSVVIDGRILDLAATRIFDSPLILPQFVLQELQRMSESEDKTTRIRGQRGLDILTRLKKSADVELQINDHELPEFAGQTDEMKLVLLAKNTRAKIATSDASLNRVARLNGIVVLNMNDLANAMKPAYTAGEQFDVTIIKPGEEAMQGVGYLSDGTMVVVEGARHSIGKEIRVSVTSVLQTTAGRMIFGKVVGEG